MSSVSVVLLKVQLRKPFVVVEEQLVRPFSTITQTRSTPWRLSDLVGAGKVGTGYYPPCKCLLKLHKREVATRQAELEMMEPSTYKNKREGVVDRSD